jgi:hypothetical protein
VSKTLTSLWKDHQYWSRSEKREETRREKLIASISFFFVVISRAVFEVGASGLLIVILGCFLFRFLFLKISQLQRERLKPPGLSPAEDEESRR